MMDNIIDICTVDIDIHFEKKNTVYGGEIEMTY